MKMIDVQLTGTLKTYKAIVVQPGEEVPEGYISIASAFVKGKELMIAVPEGLLNNIKLINRLSDQADWCLMKAVPEESFEDEDDEEED
jgi:hypothetical protein